MKFSFLELFLLFTLVSANPRHPKALGPYQVRVDSGVEIGGLVSGGSQTALVAYPISVNPNHTFPIISYLHDTNTGGEITKALYSSVIGPLASHG